jgi:hypothetical protein
MTIVDEFMPVYDISDSLATVVHADRRSTWGSADEGRPDRGRAQQSADRAPGALRMLPDVASHLLHGERSPAMPARLRLRDISEIPSEQGGWALLGERPTDEIALGLVGRFWRPVIEFAGGSPEKFRDFSEPGYAKHVYLSSVRGVIERPEMTPKPLARERPRRPQADLHCIP